MKKFLSIALALTMCLSLSIPAFAEDSGWKMEVLGKSDAEVFVGAKTFTVSEWDFNDTYALELRSREKKVENLCVLSKGDTVLFTYIAEEKKEQSSDSSHGGVYGSSAGSYDRGLVLYAWTDSDGDGVYDGRSRSYNEENDSYDILPVGSTSWERLFDLCTYTEWYGYKDKEDGITEYAEDFACIGEKANELKLSADTLLEKFGPNTLISVEGDWGANVFSFLLEGNTSPSTSPSFSDVKASDYFAEPVAWAVEKGVTVGTSASTFSPDATCTQGQILTFLWRAKGEPAPVASVSDTAYYAKAAQWAKEQGLTDNFSAEADCTRAMVVTYLWKLAGSPAVGSATFADVPANADYAQAVAWAVAQGITNGTGNGSFSPNATCTRGQIVTFLFRALAK